MVFRIALVAALVVAVAGAARAQEPRPAPPDTTPAPADTVGAPADTTETAEELERRLIEELGRADTAATRVPTAAAQPRISLNPDISAIGDFLADLSPEESSLEEEDRFQMREVEVALQGAVDPYFRYDAFVGIHGDEVELEEGYATTLGLPAGLQVKLGQFHLPFGKINLTHRPEIYTIEYPLVIQEYFGAEGLISTGVWLSVIGDPLGFFQEISVLATNGAEAHAHGEEGEGHAVEALASQEQEEEEEEGKDLIEDLGDRLWVAHLKNSIDLTEAANLEIGGSLATSNDDEEGRTTLYGINAIWRWKPPQMAKYRSAVLQAEAAWRDADEGDTRFGAFAFAQWQLSRRGYVGARWDYVEPPEPEEGSITAGQVLLRYFPTEFSQLRVAYERQAPEEGDALDRLLFQATLAIGPHRPHPF